jgi:Ca2+-binding RTX toxin-like protein
MGPGDDVLTGTDGEDVISGLGGNDTISGLDGNDTLDGGDGDDVIDGGSGDDAIDGGAGADTLTGGTGNDDLDGGDGDDTLTGGTGADVLTGGLGADSLFGGDSDVLYGGDGADELNGGGEAYGGAGNDEILYSRLADGGDGDDLIWGGFGTTIRGGAGDDTVHAQSNVDPTGSYDGGDGFDTLILTDGVDPGFSNVVNFELILVSQPLRFLTLADVTGAVGSTLVIRIDGELDNNAARGIQLDGSAETDAHLDVTGSQYASDTIYGGALSDVLRGVGSRGYGFPNGGRDTLYGNGGDDLLIGGADEDWLYGGTGNDTLEGEAGDDLLTGGAGDDIINGGAGDDTAVFSGNYAAYLVTQGAGFITVAGPDGTDTLTGINKLRFDDQTVVLSLPGITLTGTSGDDDLSGTDGEDFLFGGDGHDTLDGNDGPDLLEGGSGADMLTGGDGDDTVDAGSGDDLIVGGHGGGDDAYVGGEGVDTVRYASATSPVVVDLAAGTASGADIGNDTLTGIENVIGGAGDDVFVLSSITSGLPDSIYDGGGGIDTFDCSQITSFLSFRSDQAAPDTFVVADNRVANVERVIGGSAGDIFEFIYLAHAIEAHGGAGDDQFFWSNSGDRYFGDAGNDYFHEVRPGAHADGGDGDDTFFVSGGFGIPPVAGSIEGGAGRDLLQLNIAFSVDLAAQTAVAGAASYTISSIEHVVAAAWLGYATTVSGSAAAETFSVNPLFNDGSVGVVFDGRGGDDHLTGSVAADTLIGGAGEDHLNGGDGADTLTGGLGTDYLTGGAGADQFVVDAGSDYIADFADGDDVLQVSAGAVAFLTMAADWVATTSNLQVAAGVNDYVYFYANGHDIDLSAISGGLGYFVLSSNVSGASVTLIGSGSYDQLVGLGGDTLTGGGGGDYIAAEGSGTVTVTDLGNGADTLLSNGSTINATLYGAWTATAETVNLLGTVNLFTAGHDVDLSAVIYGSRGFNVTNTGAAATLTGSDLGDTLTGGVGDDTLRGGGGNDLLKGGAGFDTVVYGGNRAAYTITDLGGGIYTVTGPDGTDTLSSISQIIFADQTLAITASPVTLTGTAGDDILEGDTANDSLTGLGGDDTLVGGEGNDSLVGGTGDDELNGGEGNDSLIGGTGRDTAVFAGALAHYSINDLGGGAFRITGPDGTDSLQNVDYARFDDQTVTLGVAGVIVSGDGGSNTLGGSGGDDKLDGLGGNDSLDGGDGADLIDGGDGDDALIGGAGDDILTGGDGDDAVDAGSGDDLIVGGHGGGDDAYIGGSGVDTVVYSSASSPVFVDLAAGTGRGVDIGFDTLTGIENIVGGNGRDHLRGDAGPNEIEGGGSSDVIDGRADDDVLTGGAGDDLMIGGAGADTLQGDDGGDALHGDDGDDTLIGGAGDDKLTGGAGADSLSGGTGSDLYFVTDSDDTVIELADEGYDTVRASVSVTLADNVEALLLTGSGNLDGTGNDQANRITGNSGDNSLRGGGGVDFLTGGAGNDTLDGGDGVDQLYGGDGADNLQGGGSSDVLDGGDGDDRLVGGAGDDLIKAGTGADTLEGGEGSDALHGDDGDDTLNGGAGADRLSGGRGVDSFAFLSSDIRLSSSGLVADTDRIIDLSFLEGDRVDLSQIDANQGLAGDQAFIFVAAFTGSAGEAVLSYAGGGTVMALDVDGDGVADLSIQISGDVSSSSGNLFTGVGDTDGGWIL